MINFIKELFIIIAILLFIAFLIIIYIELMKAFNIINKQNNLFISILTAQKPLQPSVPKIMPYQNTMTLLNQFIKTTFERIYTTEVMPQLTNGGNKAINTLAPKDVTYELFMKTIVIQIITNIPFYLKKSIYYHFNIIKTETDNMDNIDYKSQEFNTYILYVSVLAKNYFDIKLIHLASLNEKYGDDGSEIFNAYYDYGKLIGSVTKNISSPDGSEVTVDNINYGGKYGSTLQESQ